MKIGVIVQARMSSQRLPGKVLQPVQGKPLLEYLLEGLACCDQADEVLVATSDQRSDDPIEEFCDGLGVHCFRGPLEDVATRFLLAARETGLDAFVRICGDSPFLDFRLVDAGIHLFRKNKCDLVTNVLKRTYPKGQSVEVVNVKTFQKVCSEMVGPEDREHVTRLMYAQIDDYMVVSFESGGEYGDESLVVDTAADMERIKILVSRMSRAPREYGWLQLLALSREEGLS